MATKVCPQCGTVNPASREFCQRCGTVIAGVAVSQGTGNSWLLPAVIGGLLALVVGAVVIIALVVTGNPTKNANPTTIAQTSATPAPNNTNLPTVGSSATATPPPRLPTVTPGGVAATNSRFSPLAIGADRLEGAYRRDDGTLFGRPEVALYGVGSGYEQANANFTLDSLPPGPVKLTLTGLDDERAAHCHFQVILNGRLLYDEDNSFDNTPGNDNGVGGSDRFWSQLVVTAPAEAFKSGPNTLTLRNTTAWAGYLGIPYILVNSISLQAP